ncbi:hypothetical protein [Microlunatus speluncae]|uniref:GAP1-N2 domain-containing protein n=1 Tax=Microlunatus speluncae TaxID=2594267 RepID=UPI001266236D|nr:hypothetical protein [Microlunatus speluncae]
MAGQRYGRLTYTSLHRNDGGTDPGGGRVGGGGWQIKQEDGDLSREERDQLRARVSTQFDAGVEIPRFPTPEQIAELPRRLVYAPVEPGDGSGSAMAWWHSAPAGPDATGRPGNVFNQVVLDRHPEAPDPGTRPIEVWRSPDWLAPYGVEQVSAAALTDHLRPVVGPMITAEAVIGFLLDPAHYRFGVLAALLDATAAVLAGGPRVVLITESTDGAALWAGAVSLLMAAPHAARFAFSTLERVSGLPIAFDQGVQVACVPAVDRDQLLAQAADPRSALRQTPLVVIDEAEAVAIGDLDGEPHRTAAGDRIRVTEWSVLAQVVLGDEAGAGWALAELDRVVQQLPARPGPSAHDQDRRDQDRRDQGRPDRPPDDHGRPARDDDPAAARQASVLPPDAIAWPLAMAVGRAGERFADAVAEAAAVVTRTGPRGLADNAALHQTARDLIGLGLGRSAADAWRIAGDPAAMARMGAETGQFVVEAYVRRAIAEPSWLARPGRLPLPEPTGTPASSGLSIVVERELLTDLPGHCAAITAAPDLDPAGRLTALLHLIDLLARCGLSYLEQPEVLVVDFERYCYLLAPRQPGQPAGPEPSAIELIGRIGPVSEPALRWVVRPVLAGQEWINRRPIGSRLDPPVAAWLYPDEGAPPPLGRLVAGTDDPLRAELAHDRWTSEPERHPGERPLVAWSALTNLAPYQSLPTEVERTFDGPPWPAGDLLLIRRRWPAAVGVRQWAPTVKSAPADEELKRLIDDLRDPLLSGLDDHRHAGSELIELRRLARDQFWLRDRRIPEDREVTTIISGSLWAWDLPGELASDAANALLCALVLDVVRDLRLPAAQRLRAKINSGRGFELQRESADLLRSCFSRDSKEGWLRTTLLADRGFALAGVDRTAAQWVGGLTADGKSFLNVLVREWAGSRIGNQWEQARRITADKFARRVARLDVDQRALARQAESRLRAIAQGDRGPGLLGRRGKGS